jgi:CRISPR/Cas system-associated endonuclease Cas1
VRIAIAEAGLDPSIGYRHVCQSGRHALVCDLVEVDREVLAFIQSQTFTRGISQSSRRWRPGCTWSRQRA